MKLDRLILIKQPLLVLLKKVFLRTKPLLHFQQQIEDYFYRQFRFLIHVVVNQHFRIAPAQSVQESNGGEQASIVVEDLDGESKLSDEALV